jgi:hypothetical protein
LPVEELDQMLDHIDTKCPRLDFVGFMAMGKLSDREGFVTVRQIRDKICAKRAMDVEKFVLSMGTSLDFEMAIEEGATEVRLGSTIFGERNYPQKSNS